VDEKQPQNEALDRYRQLLDSWKRGLNRPIAAPVRTAESIVCSVAAIVIDLFPVVAIKDLTSDSEILLDILSTVLDPRKGKVHSTLAC
jgi:hypothetical protein